eukprot:TRINITY_DN2259_c0_g1_i3.p1 TRINITY_DN2259_c0_g1~~TRINITY_DN2259_c0_g1_i3.p1  ORF type:complete len:183 (+),score=29.94 TRINITY_DN2259_c0_g1_i3:223-771(+)
MQTPPAQERPTTCEPEEQPVACVIPAARESVKHPWSKQQKTTSEAHPAVQEPAGLQNADRAVTRKKQSPIIWSEQEVPEISQAVPAPERPRARRRKVSSQVKVEEQNFAGGVLANSTVDELGQLTPKPTMGRLMICYFQNRHMNSPESYAPCGRGDNCNFCHKMHPLIKRRNCRVTAFCNCA